MPDKRVRTFTHWGAYDVAVSEGRIVDVLPIDDDPDPSSIGRSFIDGIDHRIRIRRPAVRQSWLENGPGPAGGARGAEPFVEVSWDRALTVAAEELERVRTTHGNTSIFGGSYGWASAGRFHHAQSQVHRFLNQLGGYTSSVKSYSTAAAQAIIPHVLGREFLDILDTSTAWPVIAEHSELIVMFGGMPLKNAQVNGGGVGRHVTRGWLEKCRAQGIEFVNIGPLREDAADFLEAQWLPIRPNTDTAFMLGLAHTLVSENLHDTAFLDRFTQGYEVFEPYLRGEVDGTPKDAKWAAEICDTSPGAIQALARRLGTRRSMITLAWSLQRADHGEQPFWMAAALAAMVGQIGLPGGGVGYGYAAEASIGNPTRRMTGLTLDQGVNATGSFIPVARIADMLLQPGASFDYNGRRFEYPDARLIYWCGGNPFHHHQDLNRLTKAWQRPDTVIVHEPWWSPAARHADIVFPATTSLERNDIGRASNDDYVFPMHRAIEPVGEARSDFEIFSGLAEKLGFRSRFTEDRDEGQWLRHLYQSFRERAGAEGIDLPDFDEFWESGGVRLPLDDPGRVLFADFRADPEGCPLGTPSGLIEIFSERIDSFGYDDCPGHPTWLEPAEWSGGGSAAQFPLHLVSNQPATRLHSQLDQGETSTSSKIKGREPMRIHPDDAASRGIEDGDVVRLFNDRGSCLAGAIVTDAVMPGAVVLSTGAWFDPDSPGGIDRHGNPNVLTLDKGTSRLGQGPSAHTTMVQAERAVGDLPPVAAFDPPVLLDG